MELIYIQTKQKGLSNLELALEETKIEEDYQFYLVFLGLLDRNSTKDNEYMKV